MPDEVTEAVNRAQRVKSPQDVDEACLVTPRCCGAVTTTIIYNSIANRC